MDDLRNKTEEKWGLPNEGINRRNQLAHYYLFAKHSAQIESHIRREENGQLLLENQRKCCDMLLEKAKEHMPLTIELLKNMHEVLLHGII